MALQVDQVTVSETEEQQAELFKINEFKYRAFGKIYQNTTIPRNNYLARVRVRNQQWCRSDGSDEPLAALWFPYMFLLKKIQNDDEDVDEQSINNTQNCYDYMEKTTVANSSDDADDSGDDVNWQITRQPSNDNKKYKRIEAPPVAPPVSSGDHPPKLRGFINEPEMLRHKLCRNIANRKNH